MTHFIKATFFLARDFLGDTMFHSESREETQKWIDSQWNKQIYTIKEMELLVPVNEKGERL